jgi:hypothetical protein
MTDLRWLRLGHGSESIAGITFALWLSQIMAARAAVAAPQPNVVIFVAEGPRETSGTRRLARNFVA